MTKKLTAALLALLTLLGSLSALAEAQYGAWTIELTDITITAEGEAVDAAAGLTVRVGYTEDHDEAWLTADIVKDGESLGGFMAEETKKGASRYAYTAGDTCGAMDGQGGACMHRLIVEQLGMKDIPDSLADAVDMLDAFLNMPKGVEYLFGQLGSAKKQGKTAYAVSVALPGGRVAGTLSWRWDRRAKKPFDLSGRREAAYSADGGIDGAEGMAEAREAIEDALMEDESMEETMIALMLLLGE